MTPKNLVSAGAAALLFALATTVVQVQAAAQIQTTDDSLPADVEKAVMARLAEIQDAAESLDPEKLFGFVLENDKGALVQNGNLFLTREAALQSTKQGFEGLEKVTYRFDQQHISLLSPTVAIVTGEGVSSATTVDGRTIETRFAQSVVLILKDKEWKVFHAHRSFPPAK